jgi:glyoxylase-like metal-dependent hydrolase (beta-lactamase superfamily II)
MPNSTIHPMELRTYPVGKARMIAYHVLRTGDEFKVGAHTLRVHETPGHCIDQIAFEVVGEQGEPSSTIIVGDAVFAGGPGHTRTNADFKTTLKTLQNVVLRWPADAMCYPGHGPSFRLGDKRAAIAAFASRDHGNFFGDAEW